MNSRPSPTTFRDVSEAVSENSPESLDPLRFPLHGSRLIEAGAGTGKTFTIAALYLRLVLGHGGEQAFPRTLTPPEILVVTFTDAATQELRERIRSRLAEAAGYFLADPASVVPRAAGGDLLHDLRAEYPDEQWSGCARKLQLAAEWMDEAAVSTIHGWCNRMLREHAFDSDCLFTQTLETDQSELLGEVVRDYWRTFMAPLDGAAVAEVRPWCAGPGALQKKLGKLVGQAALLAEANEPADALHAARTEKLRRLSELKAPWAAWVGQLQELLDTARDRKLFNGTKLKKNNYDSWLQALAAWRDDPESTRPALSAAAKSRLSASGLDEIWKDRPAPQHDALGAIAALDGALSELPDARQDLLRHAARWVAKRFAEEQERRAQMGFDDLLTRLDEALRGDNGERLAQTIRRQFPVAMIDEFQDTDPVQYRIFDAVYRVADNDPDTALILIGDPKQAIYAFRGADIHTYLAARQSSAGRLYTLKRNFRSTAAMVAATNRCFAAAEARQDGAGAFLFRGKGTNPVPFVAADAQGRQDRFEVGGAWPAALTVWHLALNDDGKSPSKGAYVEQMAAVCASQMVRLLNLGDSGQAGLIGQGAIKALRPADMAVLVNGRSEADAIRGALSSRGVRSVYLSDRDSVFQSAQAAEMQHWLAACAEPDDSRVLRAALATATLGLAWDQLDNLRHDELAWESRVVQFRAYRECWRRQGVLPMLRRLLNDFGVPARLLGAGANGANNAGERILTDLLHLAELLQQASTLLDGEHALIRFLAEQQQDAGRGSAGDARQLRLESDADLVKVVTVHKSKGLEYPLVFLPFACAYRPSKPDELPIKYHDDAGCLQLALANEGDALERADRERLGEDLRKLYVALTRARYATWVGVAPLDEFEHSALGYLIGGGQALESGVPDSLERQLIAWRGGCDEIALESAPQPTSERLLARAAKTVRGEARSSRRKIGENWWIASYSTIRSAGAGRLAAAETPAEEALSETQAAPAAIAAADSSGAAQAREEQSTRGAVHDSVHDAVHDFPRGAAAGSFLHELLEWASIQGFARVAANPALLADTLGRRCATRGWERWVVPLGDWLQSFLTTPWRLPAIDGEPTSAFSLAGLESPASEMEFWLAAHRVDIEAIDSLVAAHTLAAAPRPALPSGALNGMLKGFIDLVFEHQGRYYVADYKSNWLGPDDSAYTVEAMRGEILHARYELQYVLYLFALHRLLKARLPDYDYDRHVGGAVYLFLRGLHAPSQGLFVDRPPRQLFEALDVLFARDPSREAA
jgi:exodeoxyribonuclease V beta subunit